MNNAKTFDQQESSMKYEAQEKMIVVRPIDKNYQQSVVQSTAYINQKGGTQHRYTNSLFSPSNQPQFRTPQQALRENKNELNKAKMRESYDGQIYRLPESSPKQSEYLIIRDRTEIKTHMCGCIEIKENQDPDLLSYDKEQPMDPEYYEDRNDEQSFSYCAIF
ncbi:UNKNOWN [Stylonychia lemnae]|uniref:Uncharacterized protein n=1 Tax=Stylonychia lemnae TaxID=5949 RepID=A0A078ADA1_STYLE|nr:UNKNOWN [Stylonychia lemnae]|eukprot:CDW80219.1 UNKNOWN [Stylonychia lemnae]